MSRALEVILSNPNHPLRFLVNPATNTWYARSHLSELPTVQAGHLVSRHSGAPERYGLQDSWRNQQQNWRGETQGAVFTRDAVDVGGVPVEKETALMWQRTGMIK
jgi:hypothetical protein